MTKQLTSTLHFIKIVLFLFLSKLATVEAATQLDFAEAFNIKAFNGVAYSSGLVNQNRTLTLRAGLNLIAIEFEEVYESDDDDDFDIVKSNVFLLRVYLQQNKQYQQRFTKPHNASAAKRYVLNPIFEIIDINNRKLKPIRFELSPLASNEKSYVIAQTKLRRNATLDLSHPGAKSKTKSKTKSLKIAPNQKKNAKLIQSNASKMLDYWWHQATPEERKAFLESVSTK
jgi:uncharacterized protein